MRHAVAYGWLWMVAAAGCASPSTTLTPGPSTFQVTVTAVNGSTTLPAADHPLPANRGDTTEAWDFEVTAQTANGEPADFDGYVRVSVHPGAVLSLTGNGTVGRSMLLQGGKGTGRALMTAVYGPARLWIEDLGYTPAPAGKKPACADGTDNNGNVLVDFPVDPGCAFADDDNEAGGSFAAGVSAPVAYAQPKISDVRGQGSATPYPYEGIEINTRTPQRVVVTRVASDGFYVTDVSPAEVWNPAQQTGGYNSLFAFNFSTPPGMRVCDVLTYLSGTANDFYGFTELSFPSYQVNYPLEGQGTCEVPEPLELDETLINNVVAMQRQQSALVRIQGFQIADHWGPGLAKNNVFTADASNCDFNGDGQIDFTSSEGGCAEACDAASNCSEWTAYSARGEYKVHKGNAVIKIQTSTIVSFDPTAHHGALLDAVTGTLRKFSGGSLNWTIETRCADDLACSLPGCGATTPVSSTKACVRLRTTDDNDEGTN